MREDGSFTHEGRKERREKNSPPFPSFNFDYLHVRYLSFSSIFESNFTKTDDRLEPEKSS